MKKESWTPGSKDKKKKTPKRRKTAQTEWKLSDFKVEPKEGKTRFHDLGIAKEIMHAVADLNFEYCMPIQNRIIPYSIKGRDCAGQAQTGTGKTAAFLITIIDHCLKKRLQNSERRKGTPRALVVAPTRELALQIKRDADELSKYADFKTVAVYGGMHYKKQQCQLDKPVDLIVATPGRLLDFNRQRILNLRKVEILVLDEADRMLDMGFIPDIRRIVYATPKKGKRQTLLFSATLPDKIMKLASAWLVDPARVEIAPDTVAADNVNQKVFTVTNKQKFPLLYNLLKQDHVGQTLIFANRRVETERLVKGLRRYNVNCDFISGAVNQKKRLQILEKFRKGKIKNLVATDVAGRGLHVDDISHVINFNIPCNPDDYVHRIGRTGRVNSTGTSVTFACEMESFEIPKIEEVLGEQLDCIRPDKKMLNLPPPPKSKGSARKKKSGKKNRKGRSKRSRAKN